MSTSQPQQQPPVCPEHGGMMVPMDVDYGMLDAEGFAIAIVGWSWDEEQQRIKDYVYAPDDAAKAQLPQLGAGLGDAIYELEQNGRLVPSRNLITASGARVIRLDDSRGVPIADAKSYLFAVSAPESGPQLRPNTVYRYYEDGVPGPLTDFDEIVSLMNDPSVLLIEDTSGVAGSAIDDPKVMAKWSLDNRVVVWDETAIYKVSLELA